MTFLLRVDPYKIKALSFYLFVFNRNLQLSSGSHENKYL